MPPNSVMGVIGKLSIRVRVLEAVVDMLSLARTWILHGCMLTVNLIVFKTLQGSMIVFETEIGEHNSVGRSFY